jgi:hypothetical protein
VVRVGSFQIRFGFYGGVMTASYSLILVLLWPSQKVVGGDVNDAAGFCFGQKWCGCVLFLFSMDLFGRGQRFVSVLEGYFPVLRRWLWW